MKGKQLTPIEALTLESLRVSRGIETRYAGVEFFVEHQGLRNTCLAEVRAVFPCYGRIDVRDGAQVKEKQEHHVGTCGQQRFCENCSRLLRVLARCWHLHSATEVLLRVFLKAFKHWSGEEDDSAFFDFAMPAHRCDDNCPKMPRGSHNAAWD